MNLIYTTCYLDISGVTKLNFDILSALQPECTVHVCVTASDAHLATTWHSRFTEAFAEPFELWRLPPGERYDRFVDYLKRHRIDLVFNTHSMWLYQHAGRLKRDCPRLKIVDSLHVLEPCRLRGGSPDISANRFVHPHLDRSILISMDLFQYLTKNYPVDPKRFVVVRNGIDTARFLRSPSPDGAFREELGIPGNCRVVGFIGRLSEQKRPHLFLEVARRVLEVRDDVRFYLLGDGPLAPKLARQAARLGLADRVAFLPPRDDVPAVLAETDLLLVTSLYEGAPLTILEALASGVPVISSDVGAIREYVSSGCDLIATAPRKTEAKRFAEAVLGRLLGGTPPLFDVNYFDLSRVAHQYRQVFCEVCTSVEMDRR